MLRRQELGRVFDVVLDMSNRLVNLVTRLLNWFAHLVDYQLCIYLFISGQNLNKCIKLLSTLWQLIHSEILVELEPVLAISNSLRNVGILVVRVSPHYSVVLWVDRVDTFSHISLIIIST